jgi:hypothetical protein
MEEGDLRAAQMLRTVIRGGEVDLVLFRVPDLGGRLAGSYAMVGTWPGQAAPVQFAAAAPHTP